MAQMTLGAAKRDEGPRPSRASEDDLPVFSASSFSAPAAGVLLPTVQPSSNRLVYVFMGVVGLLALAAIVLVAVILLGKKDPAAALAEDPAALAISDPARTETPPAVVSHAPGLQAAVVGHAARRHTAVDRRAGGDAALAHRGEAAGVDPAAPSDRDAASDDGAPTHRRAVASHRDPPDARAARRGGAASVRAGAAPGDAEVRRGRLPGDAGSALLSEARLEQPSVLGGDSSLPDRLEQADIIAGMKAVNGRVMACNDRTRVPGTFKVKVTVGADGSVNSATAGPPVQGTAAESCVESAVKGARFKRTKNSITFNYPYTFR
jgi:hypothetical protein